MRTAVSKTEYHLTELKIALDPTDRRHINPPPVPRSSKVLDLGCGAGQTLLAAYPDRVTFGVDIDFGALKLGSSHAPQVRFVCAGAEDIPFADGAFDEVIARGVLPYTSIRKSLREIRRVLNRRGFLWMTLHPLSLPWHTALRANWKGKIHFAYVVVNGICFNLFQRQFPYPLGMGHETFQTERGMRRALKKAGFQDVRVERKNGHFLMIAS
jgi:ubiquinone/menaquinone biosynthesis C-methylase UbiE